jgi:hypothetical protein
MYIYIGSNKKGLEGKVRGRRTEGMGREKRGKRKEARE